MAAVLPFLLAGVAGGAAAKSIGKKSTPSQPTQQTAPQQTAEQRLAVEQEAGATRSKKAAASLSQRGAGGFGANPNRAKPFLLSL